MGFTCSLSNLVIFEIKEKENFFLKKLDSKVTLGIDLNSSKEKGLRI